jgi:hypothetical protein
LDACTAARSLALQDAIQARALLGYGSVVNPKFSDAVSLYLAKSLVRRTRTAEETYYNIIRIQNTREMIYAEDKVFDADLLPKGMRKNFITWLLVGSGYDPQKKVSLSYSETGWLKTADSDPGSIWWLMFGARWGQDSAAGAESLRGCWEQFWSRDEAGGLMAPFCNAMTLGSRLPTPNDIAYGSYLLNGLPVLSADIPFVPRFTLHDGAD